MLAAASTMGQVFKLLAMSKLALLVKNLNLMLINKSLSLLWALIKELLSLSTINLKTI